jgi:hypothetical protein
VEDPQALSRAKLVMRLKMRLKDSLERDIFCFFLSNGFKRKRF